MPTWATFQCDTYIYLIKPFELIVSLFFLTPPPPQEWYPHFFVLTSTKIYYSEETSSNQGNDDEEEHREVSRPYLLLIYIEMTITIHDFELELVTGVSLFLGM